MLRPGGGGEVTLSKETFGDERGAAGKILDGLAFGCVTFGILIGLYACYEFLK